MVIKHAHEYAFIYSGNFGVTHWTGLIGLDSQVVFMQ